ncbi:MAG: ArsR/SmtB family transcription factor [Acidimicrobiia bacterium]
MTGRRASTEPTALGALDALGDPNRRAILELLAAGPSSVQAVADRLPISRPAVSRHLRVLKEAALVGDEPIGTQRIYALRNEGVDAIRAYFEQLWGEAAKRYRLSVENLGDRSTP